MRLLIAGLSVVSAWLGCVVPAGAVPRFAARYAQNCQLCHVNPTGGGQRSLYASQFIVPTELAMRRLPPDEAAKINPQVGDNVTLGADLRTLFLSSERSAVGSGFFQMQASLYLALQLDERWSACLNRGQGGGVEAFGLGYVLPASGYVKVGRFVPAFGLQLEDHTAAVREELGLAPPAHTETGVEVGLYPGRFAVNLALLNGAPGASRDNNGALATSVRASGRARLGPLLLAAGGSLRRNPEPRGERLQGGPFATLVWGPLTWLGEFDWARLDSTDGGRVTAWVTTHELTWALRQGLDARATYSFHDPDLERLGGAQARWGAGLDARPYPFLGLQAMVNLYRRDDGPELAGRDDTQTVVMAHFFY